MSADTGGFSPQWRSWLFQEAAERTGSNSGYAHASYAGLGEALMDTLNSKVFEMSPHEVHIEYFTEGTSRHITAH